MQGSDNSDRGHAPGLLRDLQIKPEREPETIHRVYRLLAQRSHPDNAGRGTKSVSDADRAYRSSVTLRHVPSTT